MQQELYVYETDTLEVVAIITGPTNDACESVVAERYGDTDYYLATYTPAFGASDGLIERSDAELIDTETAHK